MPTTITPHDLEQVRDSASLFDFLGRSLGWPVSAEDTFTYAEPLLQSGAGAETPSVQVSRLLPFGADDKFLILLAEWQTPLRRVELREILQKVRARIRSAGAYGGRALNEIVFVCPAQDYGAVWFAHFEEQDGRQPRLQVFGWEQSRVEATRTLREINLPALAMPPVNLLDAPDWDEGYKRWLKAWDVQAVTRDFFNDYKKVFELVQGQITGVPGDAKLFTQRLMNRLLFLQFLAKRGWLRFGDGTNQEKENYLPRLWQDWKTRDSHAPDASFYRSRLRQLFFLGLNNSACRDLRRSDPTLFSQIGEMPFLNGGLFEEAPEDKITPDVSGANVPNSAMKAVLDLFASYNFTITESTPDDLEVAVDPEMLGEVFERLVTQDERKSSGSYYTPRSIVQFMCREALKGYLSGLDAVVDRVPGASENVTKREADAALRKLSRMRIVDPACGSGAYLLGMLHELFDLMGILETRLRPLSEQDKYQRKLDIIQKNLYGVDLQEFAIETARLRLWLSLVVEDERHPLDNPDDCDVALPNLDFKIEAGDSLAAPSPRSLEFALYGAAYAEDAQALARLEAEFFAPNRDGQGRKKNEVRADIQARLAAIKHLIGSDTQEGVLDWRVAFAEVFAPEEPAVDLAGALNLGGTLAEPPRIGGFDVVLANPPYGATVGDTTRDIYFDPKQAAEKGQSKDTYGLFIARAIQLLKPGGQFCYIVSDTWRTIKSHKPLRRRLAQTTTVRHVLDLPSWVFDGPTVNTNILTFTLAPPPAAHTLIAGDLRNIPSGDWRTLESNLRSAAANGPDVQTTRYARYTYPQSKIRTYDNFSFFIGSPKLYDLMSDPRFQKLGEIADVKHGLTTGSTGTYVYKDTKARGTYKIAEENLKVDPAIAARILSPEEKANGFETHRLSERYFVPYDKGGASDINEGWLPNYYVPTQYYIDWRKDSVARMKKLPGFRHDGKEYFFRSGISFSHTGVYSPTFRMSSGGIFDTAGSCLFPDTDKIELTLGLLCSVFNRYQFKSFINHTVNAAEDPIKEIRIPFDLTEAASVITTKVQDIISQQQANPRYPYYLHEQKEIDALVYALYGLDADDIREVELWYCRRYDRLAQAQGLLADVQTKYAAYLAHADSLMTKPPEYWNSHPWLTLIAQGEGARLDFKQALGVNPHTGAPSSAGHSSIVKAVAAFRNTNGGTVLLGVSDAGDIKGLAPDFAHCTHKNADGFELKLRQLLNASLSPPPHSSIAVSFETFPEGVLCRVDVPADPGITYLNDTEVYVRDGNQSVPLTGRSLVQWSQGRRV